MAKPKKWLRDTDNLEEIVDEMMERILERDGIGAYEAASGDFLTGYCNTIVHMDGSPERLIMMLRRLEAMYGGRGSATAGRSRTRSGGGWRTAWPRRAKPSGAAL
jgi:hypothetical protein